MTNFSIFLCSSQSIIAYRFHMLNIFWILGHFGWVLIISMKIHFMFPWQPLYPSKDIQHSTLFLLQLTCLQGRCHASKNITFHIPLKLPKVSNKSFRYILSILNQVELCMPLAFYSNWVHGVHPSGYTWLYSITDAPKQYILVEFHFVMNQ